MPQKIIIKSTSVEVKKGDSKRTGKPYEMHEQTAWLATGRDFPERCILSLDRDQKPYQPGEYYIDAPLAVGDFSALTVARHFVLKPWPTTPAKGA